jgi:hypothetical protein
VDFAGINTGLMQFSKENLTTVEWDLGRYSENKTIKNALNLKYQAGTRTATGNALTRVINEVRLKSLNTMVYKKGYSRKKLILSVNY